MRPASELLRVWLLRILLWTWTVFFLAIVIPIVSTIAQKHLGLDDQAERAWSMIKVVISWISDPVNAAITATLMSGLTSFTAGVWLDALLRKREAAAAPPVNKELVDFWRDALTPDQTPDVPVAQRRVPTPRGAAPGYETTTKTPEELLSLFDDRTPLQATPLIEPFFGMWMYVSGVVLMTLPGSIAILRSGRRVVECRFAPSVDSERILRRYDKGSAMEVFGRITHHQNGQQLYLSNCEIAPDL